MPLQPYHRVLHKTCSRTCAPAVLAVHPALAVDLPGHPAAGWTVPQPLPAALLLPAALRQPRHARCGRKHSTTGGEAAGRTSELLSDGERVIELHVVCFSVV
jgi:hypothetical protein